MPEVPEELHGCGKSAGRRTGRHAGRAGSDAAGRDIRRKCRKHGLHVFFYKHMGAKHIWGEIFAKS